MRSIKGPHATLWNDAPSIAIPDCPALFSNSTRLWLAYRTVAEKGREIYAVVRFEGVIDFRLSPINDEGVGQHPYSSAGLRWYSFHEVTNSRDTLKWKGLGARHWVVTFKDQTLDVIATSVSVIANNIEAASVEVALMEKISCENQ